MNRLYKSNHDKKLFGVCGGIAEFLKVDSTIVRLGVVLLTVFTGFPILIYFLLAFIMPKEPEWTSGQVLFDQHIPYPSTNLDDEIERLEKRALQAEVYRLRAELAKINPQ